MAQETLEIHCGETSPVIDLYIQGDTSGRTDFTSIHCVISPFLGSYSITICAQTQEGTLLCDYDVPHGVRIIIFQPPGGPILQYTDTHGPDGLSYARYINEPKWEVVGKDALEAYKAAKEPMFAGLDTVREVLQEEFQQIEQEDVKRAIDFL